MHVCLALASVSGNLRLWYGMLTPRALCVYVCGMPTLPSACVCVSVGTDPTGDAQGRAGVVKARAGKRERTRMRLRPQNSLPHASENVQVNAAQPRVSLRQQLPTLPSRRRPLSEEQGSGQKRVGEAPVSKIPQILAHMRNTSALDAFRRILLDPVEGLPDDAELTEIYLRYERGLPLSLRLTACAKRAILAALSAPKACAHSEIDRILSNSAPSLPPPISVVAPSWEVIRAGNRSHLTHLNTYMLTRTQATDLARCHLGYQYTPLCRPQQLTGSPP